MIVYQTADGTLYTERALQEKTYSETLDAWDRETQGNFFLKFNIDDWLTEAIQAGVVKRLQVIE